MGKIESEEYKIIVKRIRNLSRYKKELEELTDGIINASPLPPDGQPRGNKAGNPTEQKAMNLLAEERITFLNKTIKDIEKVYHSLNEEYKEIWDKAIVPRRSIDALEYELGMSRNTIYRRRRKIINTIADMWGLR